MSNTTILSDAEIDQLVNDAIRDTSWSEGTNLPAMLARRVEKAVVNRLRGVVNERSSWKVNAVYQGRYVYESGAARYVVSDGQHGPVIAERYHLDDAIKVASNIAR